MCPDIQKEFAKYDTDLEKWIKVYKSVNNITKQPFELEIGYERFLGPEIFFHPEVRPFSSFPSYVFSSRMPNSPRPSRRRWTL